MTDALRILLTVDPEIPVPPRLYGGIERIVDMLACGLVARGHDVHLAAHPESRTAGTLHAWPGAESSRLRHTIRNARFVRRLAATHGPFDVIHSYARLAYLLPLLRKRTPKVQSYQRHVTPRSVRLGVRLGGDSLSFTGCSDFIAHSGREHGGNWSTVYNGVPIDRYDFVSEVASDAPLVFLGRVERIKGVDLAIDVATEIGRPLVIAGNRADTGAEAAYFEEEIAPRCDGVSVRFVGPVDDAEKNHLLGQAAAVLFPIRWDEPFGIVMAEALACGTPVVGLARGALPEVVRDGVTGFACDQPGELAAAASRIDQIERSACRRDAEARFGDHVIVEAYLDVYRRAIERTRS